MSIMDMLAEAGVGGTGGPPTLPDDAGAPPAPDAADHATMIRDILDQVRMAAQSADDEQESLVWERISTMVQQILASQEKQDQDLMQGRLSPAALRRALG